MPAGAGAGFRRHRAPGLGLGRAVQHVAVAVPQARGQRVGHVGVELHARLGVVAGARARGGGLLGEQVVLRQIVALARAAAGQALQLELADIAPAPLGQREGKGLVHARRQRRQILVHQLLLQRHGGGGDQHPRAARQRHGHGRHAIGQRLAHARAGLHHGNGASGRLVLIVRLAQLRLGKSLRHLLGHAPLALAQAKALGGLHHGLEGLQGLIGPLLGGHGWGCGLPQWRRGQYCLFIQQW